MQRLAKDIFSIHSKYVDSLLTLQLVYTETNMVLCEFERTVRDAQMVPEWIEQYKRHLLEENNAFNYALEGFADFFEVDYKGKSANEVAKLINYKIQELKNRGELSND
ncbi:hypothetical protein [Lysinibacillus xylanilyticus]|uniref:hypothetical protein n=1 Tax=Lysinibacillus xylanilyticus TaxID=582475 RepID=UPI003D018D47